MNFQDLLLKEHETHRSVICSYKTQPCKITQLQNPMIKDPKLVYSFYKDRICKNGVYCENYHNYDECRRPILGQLSQKPKYYPELCKAFFVELVCEANENCPYAHSQAEIDYHPILYKTEPCMDPSCPFSLKPHLCPRIHLFEPSRVEIAKEYEKLEVRPEFEAQQRPILNLAEFKTSPCKRKENHDKKLCVYFHSEVDRRRSLNQHNYCPELCPKITKSFCSCDDNCPFAKNKVEQLYHPERYKKKFCSHYPERINQCDYENFCSFAHNETEIKTEKLYLEKSTDEFNIYKLKTVFCPFRQEHERSTCPYAHNVQDFRRDPLLFNYKPEDCPYWSKSDSIQEYERAGCMKLLSCEKCHGWKELEYHPKFYKTRPCTNFPKCDRRECPYSHMPQDKKKLRKGSSPERIGQATYPKKEIEQTKKNKLRSTDFGPSYHQSTNVIKSPLVGARKGGMQDFPSSEYFGLSSQYQSTNALSNLSFTSGGTGGFTDNLSPKFSYSSKNESSDDDFTSAEGSFKSKSHLLAKSASQMGQQQQSELISKPKNYPYPNPDESGTQVSTFEQQTSGTKEKRSLKLKNKNEFIPQGYYSPMQESSLYPSQQGSQRQEIDPNRKNFQGYSGSIGEKNPDYPSHEYFNTDIYQPFIYSQSQSAQKNYIQPTIGQSPSFSSILKGKDNSAPSKQTLPENKGFETSNFENFLSDPNKLDEIFSAKMDLGGRSQKNQENPYSLTYTGPLVGNKNILEPFTSDFGENTAKKPEPGKPKKSLYENLFLNPEKHE